MKRGEIIICVILPLHFTRILTSKSLSASPYFLSQGLWVTDSFITQQLLHCIVFALSVTGREKGQRFAERGCRKQCLALKQCSVNYLLSGFYTLYRQTQPTPQCTLCRCFLFRYDESRCLPLLFSAGFPLTLGYLHIPTGGIAVEHECGPSSNKGFQEHYSQLCP